MTSCPLRSDHWRSSYLLASLMFGVAFSQPTFSLAVDLTPELQTLICQDTKAESVPGSDEPWGCYDPLPGHPTLEERRAFIKRIGPTAIEAERQFGPPAPALAAMALIESGYGFTRMPLCSNNLYGFKWVGAKAAGNRPAFSLECQPLWDENNKYVAFEDPSESVLFVAAKLATLPAYKSDTQTYQQNIADGVDRQAAIRACIEGIASPYNHDPERYVSAVLRVINDLEKPSDTIDETTTLYHLQVTQGGDLVAATAKTLREKFAAGARYVIGMETADTPHQWCTEIVSGGPLLENELVKPYGHLAGHASAKLLECDYKFPGSDRRGWVIVLAATPENLAARIVNACNDVAPDRAEACVSKLTNAKDHTVPAGSNSFIYPITGFVREPCKGGENLIGFRHGVTIQYTDGPASKTKLAFCVTAHESAGWQRDVGLTFGIFDVFKVGRLAALTRLEAAVDGEFQEPQEGTFEGLESDPFQVYVRDNEMRAVETAYDRMMVIKAAIKMGVPVPPKR